MQVEVIRDLEQLASLRDAWDKAVENSNFDSVFVTHAWFYCWAKHFASNQTLYIVIARDGDRILGIMPLLLERHRYHFWSRTVLRSMTNLQSYKYNLIFSKTRSAEILAAMFDHLNGELPWNTMQLDFVADPVEIVSLLQAMQGRAYFRMRTEFHMDSPYIRISGTWSDYLAQRNKNVKKNLSYFERKLEKEGTTEVYSVHAGNLLRTDVACALSIERSSWKGDRGTAIANSEVETNFYYELGELMSIGGKFGLYFLEINGERIAFDYCLTHNDHFNVLKTGYNPAYSKSSPGRVLRKKVLQELFDDDRYTIYDLLGAREPWKQEWSDRAQTLLHIHIYNYRLSAMFGYTIAQGISHIKRSLRRYPRTFQALKTVARHLRPRSH